LSEWTFTSTHPPRSPSPNSTGRSQNTPTRSTAHRRLGALAGRRAALGVRGLPACDARPRAGAPRSRGAARPRAAGADRAAAATQPDSRPADAIDAIAIARAALQEPPLKGPRIGEEALRELMLLVDHRDDQSQLALAEPRLDHLHDVRLTTDDSRSFRAARLSLSCANLPVADSVRPSVSLRTQVGGRPCGYARLVPDGRADVRLAELVVELGGAAADELDLTAPGRTVTTSLLAAWEATGFRMPVRPRPLDRARPASAATPAGPPARSTAGRTPGSIGSARCCLRCCGRCDPA